MTQNAGRSTKIECNFQRTAKEGRILLKTGDYGEPIYLWKPSVLKEQALANPKLRRNIANSLQGQSPSFWFTGTDYMGAFEVVPINSIEELSVLLAEY